MTAAAAVGARTLFINYHCLGQLLLLLLLNNHEFAKEQGAS